METAAKLQVDNEALLKENIFLRRERQLLLGKVDALERTIDGEDSTPAEGYSTGNDEEGDN